MACPDVTCLPPSGPAGGRTWSNPAGQSAASSPHPEFVWSEENKRKVEEMMHRQIQEITLCVIMKWFTALLNQQFANFPLLFFFYENTFLCVLFLWEDTFLRLFCHLQAVSHSVWAFQIFKNSENTHLKNFQRRLEQKNKNKAEVRLKIHKLFWSLSSVMFRHVDAWWSKCCSVKFNF